jgi:hypothetical protein
MTIANDVKSNTSEIPFVGLHIVAKHMIHLREALESSIHTVDSAIRFVETAGSTSDDSQQPQQPQQRIRTQLKQGLEYQRSLFRSTDLRLASLEKRIDSTITLAFNTVNQRNSSITKRDSSTMKVIAAITLVFLPTTAVANVMGSQLFLATDTDGVWSVSLSPLFSTFWYVALAFTVAGIATVLVWQSVTDQEKPRRFLGNFTRPQGLFSKITDKMQHQV